MTGEPPTLESVKEQVSTLRAVARQMYEKHPSPHRSEEEGWTLERYLFGVDELEAEIDKALDMPEASIERLAQEKRARNVVANALYYRGRLDLKTGKLGVFHKKIGEKNVHWAPTELSRQADRLACEPLRHIYKETERVLDLSLEEETG